MRASEKGRGFLERNIGAFFLFSQIPAVFRSPTFSTESLAMANCLSTDVFKFSYNNLPFRIKI